MPIGRFLAAILFVAVCFAAKPPAKPAPKAPAKPKTPAVPLTADQRATLHDYAAMSLAELRVFEWRGTGRTEQIITRPSLKAVLAAVRALDGAARNDIYLYPKAGAHSYLCVGGGAGKYLLTGVLPGDRFPTLVDPARPELPKHPLRIGGQEGLYPRNWIHPLDVTLRAVEAFWNTGEFGGGGLTWGEP